MTTSATRTTIISIGEISEDLAAENEHLRAEVERLRTALLAVARAGPSLKELLDAQLLARDAYAGSLGHESTP